MMGIVPVAASAEIWFAAITSAWRRTQIGRQGRQSIILLIRPAVFDRYIPALDITGFAQTLRNATTNGANDSADALLRNPITGIAGCCARAASGHVAAAPPSRPMNSRRFIFAVIRSPRRRWRAASAVPPSRVPWPPEG